MRPNISKGPGPLIENMQNEHIVVTHATQRTSIKEIRKSLEKNLSREQFKKVILLTNEIRAVRKPRTG
jgi:hypothetical protein